jgi:hypothetical protein
MAELRQQTQPAQKPQQVPTPSKMGDKPTDKPVKLRAPALARETPSAESDQMMKASERQIGPERIDKKTWDKIVADTWDKKHSIKPGTIKKAMTFVTKGMGG